eukprot:m.50999 g.50999  ORF g.50999 m.50999 type:complete len:1039 (+) comp7277_c0_seq1:326-3442(+)
MAARLWTVGELCFAPYCDAEENEPAAKDKGPLWYPARVTAVHSTDEVTVEFEGYGNSERVSMSDLEDRMLDRMGPSGTGPFGGGRPRPNRSSVIDDGAYENDPAPAPARPAARKANPFDDEEDYELPDTEAYIDNSVRQSASTVNAAASGSMAPPVDDGDDPPPPPRPPRTSVKAEPAVLMDYHGTSLPAETASDDEYEVPVPARRATSMDGADGEYEYEEEEYEVPMIAPRRSMSLDDAEAAPTVPARSSRTAAGPTATPDINVTDASGADADDNDGAAGAVVAADTTPTASHASTSVVATVTHTPEMLYGNVETSGCSRGASFRDRASTIEHRDRLYGKVKLTRIDEPTAERVLLGCDESAPGCHLFRVTANQGIVLSMRLQDDTVAHFDVVQDIEDGVPIVSLKRGAKDRFHALEDLRHFYKTADMTTSKSAGLETRLGIEVDPSKVDPLLIVPASVDGLISRNRPRSKKEKKELKKAEKTAEKQKKKTDLWLKKQERKRAKSKSPSVSRKSSAASSKHNTPPGTPESGSSRGNSPRLHKRDGKASKSGSLTPDTSGKLATVPPAFFTESSSPVLATPPLSSSSKTAPAAAAVLTTAPPPPPTATAAATTATATATASPASSTTPGLSPTTVSILSGSGTINAPVVGQRCRVFGYDGQGTVKFVGVVPHRDKRLRIGVALDAPFGMNDGSDQGRRFFDCAENHGIFSIPFRVYHADLVVGVRGEVQRYGSGTVRYIGKVDEAGPLIVVGMEFDTPVGHHNGTFHGTSYFNCPSKCGLFVLPHEITNLQSAPKTHQTDSKTPLPSAATTTARSSAAATASPVVSPANSLNGTGLPAVGPNDVGKRVAVHGYECHGYLRFFGPSANGTFAGNRCGVELDEPFGVNNGTAGDHEYFVCEEGHGVMERCDKVTVLLDQTAPPPRSRPVAAVVVPPPLPPAPEDPPPPIGTIEGYQKFKDAPPDDTVGAVHGCAADASVLLPGQRIAHEAHTDMEGIDAFDAARKEEARRRHERMMSKGTVNNDHHQDNGHDSNDEFLSF